MCRYLSLLMFAPLGIIVTPVMAFAAGDNGYETTPETAKILYLMLAAWGVYKCFAISKRKTTNTKCAVALGFSLAGYLIVSTGWLTKKFFVYHQAIDIITVIISLVLLVISLVLAILGLMEYKKGFKQGRKQAVWAIVLNVLIVLLVSVGAAKGFVNRMERQKGLSVPYEAGVDIVDPNLNFMMPTPDRPYVKIKPDSVNPYAKVAFVRSNPQVFYILIAERTGIDLKTTTEDARNISQAALKSNAQSIEIGDSERVTINGMEGLRFVTDAVVSGAKVSYVHWVCSKNGFLYQQIAFSERRHANTLVTDSKKLFEQFRQIEPTKVCYSAGSDPFGRYVSAQFGYTLDLTGTSWSGFDDIKEQIPGADIGGVTGNEVAVFFVSVLPLGHQNPGDEAVVGAFLQSLSIEREDDKLTLLSHDNKDALSRYVYTYTKLDGGAQLDYKIKISIFEDRAYLLAVWTDKEIAAVDEFYVQVDTAMEFSQPDEPLRMQTLDKHGKLVVADALNRVGIYFEDHKKYKKATEYYAAAIDFDPTDVIFWDNAMKGFNLSKDHNKATALVEAYEEKSNLNDSNLSWYAWHLGQSGKIGEAVKIYRQLFSSSYRSEEDFKYYVRMLGKLGKHDIIDAVFDSYLNGRKNTGLRIHQAEMWYKMKQYEKALAVLDNLETSSPNIALKKIYNLQALEQFKEVLLICEQLIKANEFVGEAFYYKGLSEYRLKWYAKAKNSFEKSLERYPKDKDIKAYLKEISGILGQGDNSVIKRPIKPVPLPKHMGGLLKDAVDPEYIEGASAYYLHHYSGYEQGANGTVKYTIRRKVHIVNTAGANAFSTYTIGFNPLYERLYVNALVVRDRHGEVIGKGDEENYFIVDVNKEDEKSHDQKLNIPIPQLVPGSTFEIVATKILGNYDSFPFKKNILASRYPIISSMVYVLGDTEKIEIKGENGVQLKNFDHEKIAYVHSPLKYRKEPSQVDYHSYMPLVYVSGTGRDWAELGEEYLGLIRKQMVITDDIKKLSHSLTRDSDGKNDKIFKLYQYLQDKVKYMGLEFGSRGQIPYEASKTVKNKYGDCKDHAVLFHHLLDSAGIPNYLALVNSHHTIQEDMPSRDQFNHIINYIPGDIDRFWDTTDKESPATLIVPVALGGMQALVLEPDNIRLKKIPNYKLDDTRIKINRKFTINEKSLTINEALRLNGYYGAFMRSFLKRKSMDARHAWGQATIQLYHPSGNLEKINVLNLNNYNKPLTIELDYTVLRKIHAVKEGLIVNTGGIWEPYYLFSDPVKTRQTGFEVEYPFSLTSNNTIHVPDGYAVKELPKTKASSETDFGTYGTQCRRDKGAIQFHLEFTAKNGIFHKSRYNAYYQLSQDIIEAASPTLTLSQRGNP